MKKKLLPFLIAITLGACGGDDKSTTPQNRPTGTLSGNAVDALIKNGTIQVYAFDTGKKGELLGTSTTDSEGYYSIELRSESRPVLLELSGGYYIEETSGRPVSLTDTQKLRALTYYDSGSSLTVMITPWTNIAAGLAQYQISQGHNVPNAITESSSAIASILGLDIINTYPRNITDPNNNIGHITKEHIYGLELAQFSEFTRQASVTNGLTPHTTFTSIAFADIAYRDIKFDGALNGLAETQLALGSVNLGVESYRKGMAEIQLQLAKSDINQVGMTVDDIINTSINYASSTHQMFDSLPSAKIDNTGPRLASVNSANKVVPQHYDYAVTVEDPLGLSVIEFYIDGEYVKNAEDLDNPSVNIGALSNGAHTIKVIARDAISNESEAIFNIMVDASAPSITVTSNLLTNSASYKITGSAVDSANAITAVTVNGEAATLWGDGSFSHELTLTAPVTEIKIRATDEMGNIGTETVNVEWDFGVPTIEASFTDAMLYDHNRDSTGRGALEPNDYDYANQSLIINSDHLSLNGMAITKANLMANDYPYIEVVVADKVNDKNTIYSNTHNLTVSHQFSINGNAVTGKIIDNAPTGSLYYPFVTETFDPAWINMNSSDILTFSIFVADEAGNEANFNYDFSVQFELPQLIISSTYTDATINAYSFSGDDLGGLAGSCKTDDTGSCNIAIRTGAQPLLLKVSGGDYREPATGETVTHALTLHYIPFANEDMPVVITPFSHLYAGLVETELASGDSITTAIEEGRSTFTEIYGYDPIATPLPNSELAEINNTTQQALLLSGLSTLAYDSMGDEASSLALMAQIHNDLVYDQKLNGIGLENGIETALYYGTLPLTANTTRTELGSAAIAYLNANPVALKVSEAFDYLETIAQNSNAVFDGAEINPLDMDTPTYSITSAVLVNEPEYTLTGTATDPTTSVASVTVDGKAATLTTNGNWSLLLNLTKDWENPFTVVVTDRAGNRLNDSISIFLDTVAPELETTIDSANQNGSFPITVSASDTGQLASVAIYLDDALLATTTEGDYQHNIDTALYTNGAHTLTTVATDSFGQSTTHTQTVTFDNVAPTVTATSAALVNEYAYTLTLNVSDAHSGIDTVTINGNPASVESGTVSYDVDLKGRFIIPFTIVVTDKAGNSTNLNHKVSLDKTPPKLDWRHTENGKWVWPDGDVVTNSLNDTYDYPLYFSADKLRLGDINRNTTDLDNSGIMWIEATVKDPDYNDVWTEARDLTVETRYLLDGNVERDWTVVSDGKTRAYLIPLTTEFLAPAWETATPDQEHTIEIRVTDEIGNFITREYKFKADIRAALSEIAATNDDWTGEFANRGALSGKTVNLGHYTFTNTSQTPILISIKEDPKGTFTRTYQSGIRMNFAKIVTQEEWRVKRRQPSRDLSGWIEVEGLTKLRNKNNKFYNNAATSNIYPTKVEGSNKRIYSDLLSTNPPTEWEDHPYKCFEVEGNSFRLAHLGRDAISRSIGPDYIYADLGPLSATSTDLNKNTFSCIKGARNSEKHFQRRYVQKAEYKFTYPKNDIQFHGSGILRFEQKYDVYVNNYLSVPDTINGTSYYRIPTGATVKVWKRARLPNFTVYNDTDVAESTFSSYTKRYYDKTLTWNYNGQLVINAVIDSGNELLHTVDNYSAGDAAKTLSINRS